MKIGLLCGNLVLLAPLMGAVGSLTLALHKWILYSIDIIQRLRKENSAGADGGPRSCICACFTLRSAPIDTSGIFSAQVSGLGGRATILKNFLINFLAISGDSKHFSFFSIKNKKSPLQNYLHSDPEESKPFKLSLKMENLTSPCKVFSLYRH